MATPVRNWANNITFRATKLHRPHHLHELQKLVADTPRIRALGSGHSFNRIADTVGDLVSVDRLDVPVEIDTTARQVTVSGGARYAAVARVLDAAGWALQNLGSLPHISIAGACATGTHGSGDTNQNLAGAVTAIEFIQADGEIVRLSQHDDAFAGAVLALGALGIVTRVTLRIEPAYSMRQVVYTDMPLTNTAEHIETILAAAYSVSVVSNWQRPDVIDGIWLKQRVGADERPTPPGWLGSRLADRQLHPTPGRDASVATPQLGQVGPWFERLPHFRADFTPSTGAELQSEYFLPRAAAAKVLYALRTIAGSIAAPLQSFELRTIARDAMWLSPSHHRDSIAAHFTWVADLEAVRPALRAVEAALQPLDPRPHWAKVFLLADADRFAAIYPRLPEFRALAARYDPDRCFGNEFLERYVY